MKLYSAIDLHSNNSVVVVIDENGKQMYQKRLTNDLEKIHLALEPYKTNLVGVVVESTYNWYWLVDGLMAKGYKVHLANTTAIQQYKGIKHTNDFTDAHWLAELLRLNLLPEGYIYPKEERAIRDLLRKRGYLVQQRTSNLLSLQNIITRETGEKISGNKIKSLEVDELKKYLENENTRQSAASNLQIINALDNEIVRIEKSCLKQVKLKPEFQKLKSVPGIGNILALVIMLETGDVKRFDKVGNFSSYCRCANSSKISNGKKKGENNRKNGNKYLSWAFAEAACFSIRFNETIKKYYQKKMSKTKQIVAMKTVAHKLTKACYYIMRNEVEFDLKKAFC